MPKVWFRVPDELRHLWRPTFLTAVLRNHRARHHLSRERSLPDGKEWKWESQTLSCRAQGKKKRQWIWVKMQEIPSEHKKHFYYCWVGGQTLSRVAQTGLRISNLRDTQNSTRHADCLVIADPASPTPRRGGLDNFQRSLLTSPFL